MSVGAVQPPAHSSLWTAMRFPVDIIFSNRKAVEALAAAIWLTIPLEYYILTRIAGSMATSEYIPTVVLSILCVLAVFLISMASAFFPLSGLPSYRTKIKVWAISLVVCWSTALIVLAASYLIGGVSGFRTDVLAGLACYSRWSIGCALYPHILDPMTFVIYFVYAFIAAILLSLVSFSMKRAQPRARSSSIAAPNLFVVVGLSAAVMMVMHGLTRLL